NYDTFALMLSLFTYTLYKFILVISVQALSALFYYNDTASPELYTLSLHDALPILSSRLLRQAEASIPSFCLSTNGCRCCSNTRRSEEHTSELQSRFDLVCRLLLEKKN